MALLRGFCRFCRFFADLFFFFRALYVFVSFVHVFTGFLRCSLGVFHGISRVFSRVFGWISAGVLAPHTLLRLEFGR